MIQNDIFVSIGNLCFPIQSHHEVSEKINRNVSSIELYFFLSVKKIHIEYK